MAICKIIKAEKRKICAGDLRDKIFIKTRSITAPINESVDFGLDFTNSLEVRAKIRTIGGKEIFDGVNVIGVATHEISTRYIPSLTSENWIEDIKGQNYKILKVENLDERNEYLVLLCSVRGDKLIEANQL